MLLLSSCRVLRVRLRGFSRVARFTRRRLVLCCLLLSLSGLVACLLCRHWPFLSRLALYCLVSPRLVSPLITTRALFQHSRVIDVSAASRFMLIFLFQMFSSAATNTDCLCFDCREHDRCGRERGSREGILPPSDHCPPALPSTANYPPSLCSHALTRRRWTVVKEPLPPCGG